MITGSAPRYTWAPNEGGAVRSISEACDIARKWGVDIPDYVSIHVAPSGYLDANTYARTTKFNEYDGTIIHWESLFHKKTRKIPFLIRKDVLESDEAIVAVIGHEMFELEELRRMFGSGAPIEHWEAETAIDNEGNAHWRAWDFADNLIERMRAVSHD